MYEVATPYEKSLCTNKCPHLNISSKCRVVLWNAVLIYKNISKRTIVQSTIWSGALHVTNEVESTYTHCTAAPILLLLAPSTLTSLIPERAACKSPNDWNHWWKIPSFRLKVNATTPTPKLGSNPDPFLSSFELHYASKQHNHSGWSHFHLHRRSRVVISLTVFLLQDYPSSLVVTDYDYHKKMYMTHERRTSLAYSSIDKNLPFKVAPQICISKYMIAVSFTWYKPRKLFNNAELRTFWSDSLAGCVDDGG